MVPKVIKYFLLIFLILIICAVALGFLYTKYFLVLKGGTPNFANALDWKTHVNVYFSNSKMGSSEDCSKVFPLSRTVPNAETLGPGAIEALLKGVSPDEKGEGYFTSVNDKVLIQKFEIKDKVAYVDFSSRFNEGMGGSCRVQAIKSEIGTTLKNLSDIASVVISVNGKTEGILEP